MRIYNTLTRKKEELVPIEPNHIRIYACGPTVYNYIHIGNARPICAFDVLRRYLKYRGYEVTYVQNFTDVDDKIIRRANEEGVPASELSERYIREYKTDAHGLNVMDADIHPKVTENMDLIIDMVKKLVESGHAYESNGDVYFRTTSFADYGKLSGQPMEELQAGARIDVNDQKENPLDFAVWKAAKPGEPYWESPWGKGRPGWHIECSAMSTHYLGDTLDLHCGGQDLIFPHHENEIAQSEAATGKAFSHYWMHNGFVRVDNEKMSKSLGNFFTIRDVLKSYDAEVLRFFIIRSHYRSPLNYSDAHLDDAKNALTRLYTALKDVDVKDQAVDWDSEYAKRFASAMNDDFNTPEAVAVLFELANEVNRTHLAELGSQLKALAGVLGLLERDPRQFLQGDGAVDEGEEKWIESQIQARIDAKKAKNFAEADKIRSELLEKGIVLEDKPGGLTEWRRS